MKLNYGKTFLLGFGFFGVSIIWGVYNAFVPLFLADKFGLSAGWIGIIMVLDNIAALFIQPTIGVVSDRTRTRIGRRLPYILAGAPIAAAAFGFIPLAATLPLFLVSAVTLLLAMAVWRTPVVALMPDITPSRFRSQANGIINFMGGIGSIISFLIGGKLYKVNPSYPFWMGSVLVIVAALLVFAFIREPKVYEEGEKKSGSDLGAASAAIRESGSSSILFILAAIFLWFVGYNAIETFFTLWAVNHLGLPADIGVQQLTWLSLLFVIFALPAGYIGARIGRRNTIMIGLFFMMFMILAVYLLSPAMLTQSLFAVPLLGKVMVIGVLLMVGGAAWALVNINSLPMVVDMTEAKYIGSFTGLYYLASTAAAILGPVVNGWIIQLSGNNYNLIMIIAPVFMLLAFLAMIGVRRGEAQIEQEPEAVIQEA